MSSSVSPSLLHLIPSLVVLDFETTDSPTGQRPVEIACLRVEYGRPVAEVVELIHPQCRIDPWTQSIHGISNAMVAKAPPFVELWARLEPVLQGAVVAAHFAQFDSGVLSRELARLALPPPAVEWWCTCRLARKLWPKRYPNYKLGTLTALLGLRGQNSHRAGDDARVTLELLKHQLADAPNCGAATLERLRPLARYRGKCWPH